MVVRQRQRHLLAFENEMIVISRIRHPNIITFMGAVMSRVRPILVCEFAQLGTLRDHLKAQKLRLPDAVAFPPSLSDTFLVFVLQAGRGLAFAHSTNYAHGDVKAMNVLIMTQRHAVLGDFGSSTWQGRGAGESTDVFGRSPIQTNPVRDKV